MVTMERNDIEKGEKNKKFEYQIFTFKVSDSNFENEEQYQYW